MKNTINESLKEVFKFITRPLSDEKYLKLSYWMVMKKNWI